MSQIQSISITKPCSQSWQQMEIRENGRHCAYCAKMVIDFTKMTNDEILTYFSRAHDFCGRFGVVQLENVNRALAAGVQRRFSWKGIFAAASLAGIMSFSKAQSQNVPYPTEQRATTPKADYTAAVADSAGHFTINGYVKASDDGLPIPGVEIRIKGTNTGVETAVNGHFTLNVSAGQVLEFRYIGYQTKQISVSSIKHGKINVTLEVNATALGGPGAMYVRPSIVKRFYYGVIKQPIHKLFNQNNV